MQPDTHEPQAGVEPANSPACAASRPVGRRRDLLRAAAAAAVGVGATGTTLLSGCATAAGKSAAVAASDVSARGPVWTPAAMPAQAPALEGWVDVGGPRLWYWDTGGNGQAVIFMHAGTQSGNGWGYQQPVFAAAGYRTIGYSRRGYYRSDAGDAANPGYGAEDLDKLMQHLGVQQAHLVAFAHGGYFALDYALVHPEKVRSLLIVSSLMGIDDSEKDYQEANQRLRGKYFDPLPNEFKELHPSYRAGNPDGLAAWLKLEHEAIPGVRIGPKRFRKLTWAALESIRTPTMLMTGDGDLYTPPALLRMQALHMPHADVRVVADSGHCANWEQPAVFNSIALEFLARHRT